MLIDRSGGFNHGCIELDIQPCCESFRLAFKVGDKVFVPNQDPINALGQRRLHLLEPLVVRRNELIDILVFVDAERCDFGLATPLVLGDASALARNQRIVPSALAIGQIVARAAVEEVGLRSSEHVVVAVAAIDTIAALAAIQRVVSGVASNDVPAILALELSLIHI